MLPAPRGQQGDGGCAPCFRATTIPQRAKLRQRRSRHTCRNAKNTTLATQPRRKTSSDEAARGHQKGRACHPVASGRAH
eukprot:6585297-Alexandrium_andersonii.AAC.1